MQDDLKEAKENKQKNRGTEPQGLQQTPAYKKEMEALTSKGDTPASDKLAAFDLSGLSPIERDKYAEEIRSELQALGKKNSGKAAPTEEPRPMPTLQPAAVTNADKSKERIIPPPLVEPVPPRVERGNETESTISDGELSDLLKKLQAAPPDMDKPIKLTEEIEKLSVTSGEKKLEPLNVMKAPERPSAPSENAANVPTAGAKPEPLPELKPKTPLPAIYPINMRPETPADKKPETDIKPARVLQSSEAIQPDRGSTIVGSKPLLREKEPIVITEMKPPAPQEPKMTPPQISKESAPTLARQAPAPRHEEEFSSLIKRVSESMAGKVVKPAQPLPAKKPEKDSELKDLISRISKNIEKEKELLDVQKKTATPAQPLTQTPKETLRPSLSATRIETPPDNLPIKETTEAAPTSSAIPKPLTIERPVAPLPQIKAEVPQIPVSQKPEAATAEAAGLITAHPVEDDTKKLPLKGKDGNYANPENRLVLSKQEFYSSLHKTIRPKTEEASLDGLQEIVKEKEVKLSDDEEKRLLKKQIIKKYHPNASFLPWKKLALAFVLILVLLGAVGGFLYLRKAGTNTGTAKPADTTKVEIESGESIAALAAAISDEVTGKQDKVAAINYFDSEVEPWNSFPNKSIIRLNVNYNDHEVMLPRDNALKTVLGEEHFNSLPADLLKLTSPRYNILAFKSNDSLRLGIALQYDTTQTQQLKTIMAAWEKAETTSAKVYTVMKPLFLSDKVDDKKSALFQKGVYNGVEISYANLPDVNTSIDYFTIGDMLLFTTSKDTTFEMIDLLNH
jgi:hypothetical protein